MCEFGLNEAVWIRVNGFKLGLAPGHGDVSVDNISASSNANIFRHNRSDIYNTEMDGLTIALILMLGACPRRGFPRQAHSGRAAACQRQHAEPADQQHRSGR